eukprot:5379707-Pyramimonas_sp.AAC.1
MAAERVVEHQLHEKTRAQPQVELVPLVVGVVLKAAVLEADANLKDEPHQHDGVHRIRPVGDVMGLAVVPGDGGDGAE